MTQNFEHVSGSCAKNYWSVTTRLLFIYTRTFHPGSAKHSPTNLSIVDHCTRFQQCIYPIFSLPNDFHPRSVCTSLLSLHLPLIGAKTIIILCCRAWMAPKAWEIAAFMSRAPPASTFNLCVMYMQNNQSVRDFHRPPVLSAFLVTITGRDSLLQFYINLGAELFLGSSLRWVIFK